MFTKLNGSVLPGRFFISVGGEWEEPAGLRPWRLSEGGFLTKKNVGGLDAGE